MTRSLADNEIIKIERYHMNTGLLSKVVFLLFCIELFSGCNVDILGCFYSESTPDSRFEESRTLEQPADIETGENFSFIFVSDLHIANGVHHYLEGLKNQLNGAAFIVFGGDITQNGKKEDVECFQREAAELNIPYFTVPGNHDLYNGGWNRIKVLGPSSFSVRIGNNVRLICLDSANGTLGEKQFAWLSSELSKATEPILIVATHVQFFKNTFIETQQMTEIEETALLLDLFAGRGVDLLLAGHSHRYEHTKIGTIDQYVSGAFLDGTDSACYLFVTVENGKINAKRKYYNTGASGN